MTCSFLVLGSVCTLAVAAPNHLAAAKMKTGRMLPGGAGSRSCTNTIVTVVACIIFTRVLLSH